MSPHLMWSSCFPAMVQQPSMDAARLSQIFPNLNNTVKPPKETSTSLGKHPSSSSSSTSSSALDLSVSTKKPKLSKEAAAFSGKSSHKDSATAKALQSHLLQNMSHSMGLKPGSFEEKMASSYLEQERKAASSSGCTCELKNVDDIRLWTPKDVCHFLMKLDGCGIYSQIFLQYRIDGRSLPFLTTEHLTKSFGMKLGHAIILTGAIARKIRDISQIIPCEHCRKRFSRL